MPSVRFKASMGTTTEPESLTWRQFLRTNVYDIVKLVIDPDDDHFTSTEVTLAVSMRRMGAGGTITKS